MDEVEASRFDLRAKGGGGSRRILGGRWRPRRRGGGVIKAEASTGEEMAEEDL